MDMIAKLFSALLLGCLAACGGVGEAEARSPIGSYVLDKAALKERLLATLSEEQKSQPQFVEEVAASVDGTDVTIDLKADGTMASTYAMNRNDQTFSSSASGEWSMDGDKVTMVITDDQGRKESKVATYVDGRLVVEQAMAGQAMQMTFVRK